MKHSQTVGICLCLALVGLCFLPWTIIPGRDITVSGFASAGTHYGKPGILMCSFAGLASLLFLVPKIWAKRVNVFITAILLAWCVRNYLVLSVCYGGECPQQQAALYGTLLVAAGILLMALLPKIPLPDAAKRS